MAESKFLKYQDKNRDGLTDVCEDKVIVAPIDNCNDCKPVPNATVPSWKNLTIEEPYFNEREALYQVTKVTPYSTTGADGDSSSEESDAIIKERFDEFVYEAMEALLIANDKDTSSSTQQGVKPYVEYSDYYLDVLPSSRLKLLYSIPCDIFNAIIEAEEEEEEKEPGPEDEVAHQVTYDTADFLEKLKKVRQGMGLYSTYLKVYQAVDSGNLIFDAGPQEGAVFFPGIYGDRLGLKPGKVLYKVGSHLTSFLNDRKIKIPGEFWCGFRCNSAAKLIFKFNSEYKLIELHVFTENCGNVPRIFKGKQLNALNNKTNSAYRDPTAMNYLINLDAMERDLTARTPKPWLDFLIEYTYPQVYSSINHAHDNDLKEGAPASCVAKALGDEAKQLGQDLLDEAFGLVDAILLKFNEKLCKWDGEEVKANWKEIGLIYDPDDSEGKKSLWAFAQEQALEDIDFAHTPFDSLCAGIIDKLNGSSSVDDTIERVFTEDLAQIKLCGLSELLMEALSCMFQGLSLEEALSRVLKAALKGMSIDNFGALFVGLPPEKQAELDALVKKKIESGDIFKDAGANQELSDTIAVAATSTAAGTVEHPWKANPEDPTKGGTPGVTVESTISGKSNRPLAKTFDAGSAENRAKLNPNVVLQAYVIAILEIYNDNYLELLNELNKFPGANIIAHVIASISCPRPPTNSELGISWIKDVELPSLCDIGKFDISMPPFKNPFDWLPGTKDLFGLIQQAAIEAIQQMVINMVKIVLTRLCSILGDAACSALALAGDLAASLPDVLTGRDTFKNIIKESLCGEGADSDTVDDTMVEMLANLGLGAAAFADEERLMEFVGDVSSNATAQQWADILNGSPPAAFLSIIDNLIEYEYTEYRDILPTEEHLTNLFKQCGNLMPVADRSALAAAAAAIADGQVNPSLCASPEQVAALEAARCELMQGRATEEQCRQMQPDPDIEEIASWAHNPPFIFPPLISDPGCDNGILPYEPKQSAEAASSGISDQLEALKNDFSTDMLGSGPWESDYGLLNMILSDTHGNPYTAHVRRVANDFGKQQYVDFYVDDTDVDRKDKGIWYDDIEEQYGAFPIDVASWLQDQMTGTPISVVSNNILDPGSRIPKFYDGSDSDLEGTISYESLEYNTRIEIDAAAKKVVFFKKPRKAAPDLEIEFHENHEDRGWRYELYLSDLIETEDTSQIINRPDDNARVVIYEIEGEDEEDEEYEEEVVYEFLSSDDTLSKISTFEYPAFRATFQGHQPYLPQVVLLHEMLKQSAPTVSLSKDQVKEYYDSHMSEIINDIKQEIADNEDAFTFGAAFDDLLIGDIEYVVNKGQTSADGGTRYKKVEVPEYDSDGDPDGTRKIKNRDQILGMSQMQYNYERDPDSAVPNRVFYLDPATFGGSYKNPPLYIKSVENKGWLGFVNVVFPELSPCKPSKTDVIDFEDIQEKIYNTYSKTPEDERLKSDPECIVENPYERILERPSVAGLEGLITATIRIFASVHFIKSLATFTKFRPTFPDNFSSMYADFIIEDMEKSFLDAQGSFAEAFNTFKDDEFWYAFLEQAVQLYDRRSDVDRDGDIVNPPATAVNALIEINDLIERLDIPTETEWKEQERLKAFASGPGASLVTAGLSGLIAESYQEFKDKKVFNFIRATEDKAKVVLKQLVLEQLEYMGKKFIDNLEAIDMQPDIYDLAYYLLENFTAGGEDLDLRKENLKEDFSKLEEGDGQYTSGGDFSLPDGSDYIGYYHSNEDEEGNIVFMAGETHVVDSHETLTPLESRIIVPIGDISDYGTETGTSTDPFVIEKYISIEGVKYNIAEALAIIKANDNSLNVSDIYAGSLRHVTDDAGRIVGVGGKLGIRYGLEFSAYISSVASKITITNVEINALDTTIGQVSALEANSKLLLCLINNLKEDDKFKLMYQYIFPFNKMTSFMAIYNDLSFLSSIGQTSTEEPARGTENASEKAGRAVTIKKVGRGDDKYYETSIADGQKGWDPPDSRSQRMFVREYDNWDRTLLRNSKARVKKIFKGYYFSRDFDPMSAFKGRGGRGKPSFPWLKNLKMSFNKAPGEELLTWFQRRRLRDNPFNSKGALCKKKE